MILAEEPLRTGKRPRLAHGVAGFVAVTAGAIVQFVAWIGAIVNSYQLQDQTWFLLTLILGLASGWSS